MEIKILDIDVEALEQKLLSIGAKKVFDDMRVITYFSNVHDTQEPFLKLTEEGKLKLSSQNDQTHEEVKLFVSRKEECVQLLATLDYLPVSEVRSRRISYELDGIDFDIDCFPGIPPFLEVDMGENSNVSFEEMLATLEIKNNRQEQMSTPQIVALYGKSYFDLFRIEGK